ncbi:MAG: tRNA preQ1(34) S-adenosylmethionine ribosyltransferase-isomerase QueA [Lachnospiraceae bacterium]|nr:tRNA preQ1(34) S-adenosylmethionine ribosyltransferase-isomerase QueA [Lachnospiraceae bacterium]
MTGTGEDKLLRSDYYYDLPEELIAQDPLDKRDSSRLLVLDRSDGSVSHEIFTDVADHLVPGDVLVLNDTRVIPARLLGTKEGTGSAAEILLLKNNGNDIWECLVKPGKKLREHAVVSFGEGKLTGEIVEVLPSGNRLVAFRYNGIWEEVLDSLGEMPLPPYITHKLKDRERYQTVYSRYEGSAAAPTAGLHFTEALLDEIRNKGIQTVFVTLHVGLGTFRPVKEENIKDHLMHTEWYEISEESADIINQTKDEKSGRIICVGTTSCRTLESAAIPVENGTFHVRSGSRETDIFIYPGYDFKITEGLITNFHLPESTLIMLVSALGGYENVMSAYREAVEKRYRFFSFGDAMMII